MAATGWLWVSVWPVKLRVLGVGRPLALNSASSSFLRAAKGPSLDGGPVQPGPQAQYRLGHDPHHARCFALGSVWESPTPATPS